MLKLTAIGSVGADAEVKQVNGKSVIEFSIAHSEKYIKNGEKVDNTTWIRCSKWVDDGKDGVAQYIKKGTKVYVEGFPKAQAYVNKKDNSPAASLELRVLVVELCGGKDSESGPQAPARPSAYHAPGPESPADDLPF